MPDRKTPWAPSRGPRDERGVVARRILEVACAQFADRGYTGATLRSIAAEAGVDAALVSYYYKSKSRLLDACLVPPADWSVRIAEAATAPVRRRGAALVRCLIDTWEHDPASATFFRASLLMAAHEQIARERMVGGFAVHILGAVAAPLDERERLVRASLASTQMVGLALTRYIWQVGAIATLPSEDVIAYIGPTIQRYLNGRLVNSS
jgi:AcrR family transcriptional regulator